MTQQVDGPSGPVAVDMGFIVFNRRTYPTFIRLLAELGIGEQPSDMSLGSACRACSVEFSSRGATGWLASPRAALRPSHVRMFPDILRFFAAARQRLAAAPTRTTLAEFLDDGRYGPAFRRHFLLPVTSAVWSTGTAGVVDFPIDYLLRFLDQHGLIGVGNALPWLTIPGGSRTYVDRIAEYLGPDAIRTGDPVIDVKRSADDVTVRTARGRVERFDAIVLAAHADDSLAVLHDADTRERSALGGFDYSSNEVVLHTDTRLLPRRSRAWASWNVDQDDCRALGDVVTMTYHMNRLQRLPGPTQYLVSVNPGRRIWPERVLAQRSMRHPTYTFRTLEAQAAIGRLQGHRRTFYAGAHLAYGFHEDGCRSGFDAAALVAGDALVRRALPTEAVA